MKNISQRAVILFLAGLLAIFAAGCAVGPGWSSPYYYGSDYPAYGYGGYSSPYYGGYSGYYPYEGYESYPHWHGNGVYRQYRYNQQQFAGQYWKNQQTFDQQYRRNLQTYMTRHPGAPVPR